MQHQSEIVCLGWGSLIWRPEGLPINGTWNPDGPALPIEFARQSKRGEITLVITKGAVLVTTLWTKLAVRTLKDARRVLGEREDIPATSWDRNLGLWSAERSSSHEEATIVGDWAKWRGIASVVWTALPPKYGNENYRIPTETEVIGYLQTRGAIEKKRAREYVTRAPAQIRTSYRGAIEREFGWKPES